MTNPSPVCQTDLENILCNGAWALLRAKMMRAPRFPLHLPAHYRPAGDLRWQDATTLDISSSGVLFRADQLPPLNSSVEFRFSLGPNDQKGFPREDGHESVAGEVVGQGRVVRVSTEAAQPGFAVVFDRYDIRPVEVAGR